MSLFKVVRCRYFDNSGRPVHPYCPKRFCSFLHPSDPGWDNGIDNEAYYSAKNKGILISPGARSTTTYQSHKRRSSPLVAQTDLFKRDAHIDVNESRRRSVNYDVDDGHSHRNVDPRSLSRDARPYHARGLSISSQDDRPHFPSENKGKTRRMASNDDLRSNMGTRFHDMRQKPTAEPAHDRVGNPASSAFRNGAQAAPILVDTPPSAPLNLPEESLNDVAKIIHLFRSMAKLSSDAVQNTMAYESEAKKMQTYTELSDALSKVSPSAMGAVSASLTDIVARHAQCKEHVDRGFQSLEEVWQEVFGVFVKGVTQTIDTKMESALAAMKVECEAAVKNIAESGAATLAATLAAQAAAAKTRRTTPTGPSAYVEERRDREKNRTRGRTDGEYLNHSRTETRDRSRSPRSKERKRRRPSLEPRSEKRPKIEEAPESRLIETNVLEEMRLKMAAQEERLRALAKENNDLKSSMAKQMAAHSPQPSSSNSVASGIERPIPSFAGINTQR
ncbi:hypothetical protein PLICRDRAFT_41718 [Plicaturopsis crispa FD-325 SS-3]|nr:hypothetical protein PLICRDRAFT_41718 [Plicaturopsis crispa FD-325 SS-3]